MKKIIVTTSINAPTEAIRKFDAMQDWDLVVIGDLKTPSDYWLKRGMYLDALAQEELTKTFPTRSNGIVYNTSI